MKKTICVLMACVMLLCLAACGSSGTASSSAASSSAASSSAASSSAASGSKASSSAASGSAAKSTASGTFKLGGTGPLTGGAAIYGTAAKQGAELAVAEINAMGGIQFDLKYEDDTHDAEKAVNAYNALKDWGMQISLGSVTSKPCEATAAKTYQDRIFALTPSASSTAVTKGKDNMFQMCFMDPNQGSASAKYIADQKLGTKIAVIYKNDDVYSSGIYDTFKAKAQELGLSVVSATTFADGSDSDFSV